MLGEEMYHRIKSMSGTYSLRVIAKETSTSVNTVRKYQEIGLEEASNYIGKLKRRSQFDIALSYIKEQYKHYPWITVVKLHTNLQKQYPEITGSISALEKYLKSHKIKPEGKVRNYAPVIETVDGGQVQVDMGESSVEFTNIGYKKVYFIVFVYSYSRKMFVKFQHKPFNTEDFILAHLESFYYFEVIPKECVYDQTKLVAIHEQYREVLFNKQFSRFALEYEFLPRVCEGYDPESKGKVERAIQYVKKNFIYASKFSNIICLQEECRVWLNEVANVRIHGTTNFKPDDLFEAEKVYLCPYYFTYDDRNHRKVDKTGLIKYNGNNYSVPYFYQRKEVAVKEVDGNLHIYDIEKKMKIAEHPISLIKGKINKKDHHYIQDSEIIERRKQVVLEILSDVNYIEKLIEDIKINNPKIARGQLRGLCILAKKFPKECWHDIEFSISVHPNITTWKVEQLLNASYENKYKKNILTKSTFEDVVTSSLDRPLETYMRVVKNVDPD